MGGKPKTAMNLDAFPAGAYKNWEFRQPMVAYAETVPRTLQDLLFDSQTSGGLLISVSDPIKIMVMCGTDRLGFGGDALGLKLMVNFLRTLKEIGDDLWRLVRGQPDGIPPTDILRSRTTS